MAVWISYFGGDVHETTQQSDGVLHVGLVVLPNCQLAQDVVHVGNLHQPPLQWNSVVAAPGLHILYAGCLGHVSWS